MEDERLSNEEEGTEITENYDYASEPEGEMGMATPLMEQGDGPEITTKQKEDERLYFGFEMNDGFTEGYRRE